MDYKDYKVEDFVTDEFFIRWVKNPTEDSDAFWNAWLSKNPSRETDVKEARQIVLMLQFKEEKAPDDKFLEIWSGITTSLDDDNSIVQFTTEITAPSSRKRRSMHTWYSVAAALLVVIIAMTYILFYNNNNAVIITTAYGESRTFFLPDSTKVTLNANSTLRYEPGFRDNNREVWLDGEAFFSVVHKKNNQNFLVHTSELQVEVLGTRFNVNSRRGKSQVVLEEGKVKLDINEDIKKSELVMKPGEMVEVSRDTKEVAKKEVDVTNYSSWRNNRLVFVSSSLEEVARSMEDNYGFEVIFKEEEIKDKHFTGSTAMDDPQELVQKLNKVFDLNIQQEGNKLIIQNK